MNELKDFILLIPYYNDFEGVISSLKSISYPLEKFGVLIVDDGSQKPLNEIELQNQFAGMQIKVLRIATNKGIVHALNEGLQFIKDRNDYKYIARLDCGDICTKDRFSAQVNYLNSHNEIGLVGSWCTFTEKGSGKSYLYKTKLEHDYIIKEMHFKCSFIHPTVMFRREIVDTIGLYPENYPHAEDYAYFWKILKQHKGAILPQVLVTIVTSALAVSAVNYKTQLRSRKVIIKDFGTSRWFTFIGRLGIALRMVLPYSLILKIKTKR